MIWVSEQRAAAAPPPAPNGDDLSLRSEDRMVDAAHRVLCRHFNRMLLHEPGTREGADPEQLHDMRVATRRMRAALRVFRHAVAPRRARALKRDLKWIGGALGAVRDLDVYLKHLRDEALQVSPRLAPAVGTYIAVVEGLRERARVRMIRAFDTRRYADFVARTRRFLNAGPPARPSTPGGAVPLTEAARLAVLKNLSKVVEAGTALGPDAPDAELHALRIRCKRLRYACEFFTDIYGEPAARFAERVVELQDALGDHQDAIVANETLVAFAAEVRGPTARNRDLLMALGELTALHVRRAAAARKSFFKLWRRFDRKSVRRPLEARTDGLRLGA